MLLFRVSSAAALTAMTAAMNCHPRVKYFMVNMKPAQLSLWTLTVPCIRLYIKSFDQSNEFYCHRTQPFIGFGTLQAVLRNAESPAN